MTEADLAYDFKAEYREFYYRSNYVLYEEPEDKKPFLKMSDRMRMQFSHLRRQEE